MKRVGVVLLFLIFLVPSLGISQEVKRLSLNDCIQIALKNNTSIVAARSDAKIATANLKSSWGNFLPKVDAYTSWRRRSEEWKTIRFDELVSSKESYYYQIELSQPIFTGFANLASLKINRAESDKSRYILDWTKQTIILDVKFKYYNVLKQKQLLKVAEDALKMSQEELKRIEEMEKIGAASRSEVYQQKVKVGQDKLALVKARNSLINAKTELNHTLGIDVTTEIELVPESAEMVFEPLKVDFKAAVREALKNRLDFKAALNSLQSAKANVSLQRSAYFPTVALFGSYNWWDVQFPESKRDIDEFDSYTFGISLSMNLFNGFKTHNNIQSAKATVTSAEANLEQAKRQITLQVKTAILNIDEALKNLEVTEENLMFAEEDYRLASERYRIGAGTILEQLTALNALNKARVDRIRAIYDYKYAVTALELAMGKLTW